MSYNPLAIDPPEPDPYEDERAEYYAELALEEGAERDDWELDMGEHPGHAFVPPPAPLLRRETWQGAVCRRLAKIAPGVELTELSDAREEAGRPRLSESSATERHYAPLWLLGRAGKTALAVVRRERARLTAHLERPAIATLTARARMRLSFRSSDLSRRRLRELRQISAIVDELLEEADEPATPLRLVRAAGGGR